MKYLLDTNIISELISRQPTAHVTEWIDSLDLNSVYLSVLTVGEIRKGIARLSSSKRKESLTYWLTDDLMIRFSDHILPLDVGVMLLWGQLTGELAAQGVNLPFADSLIGATALHHQCILVTRNEADFRHIGVTVVNPWNES